MMTNIIIIGAAEILLELDGGQDLLQCHTLHQLCMIIIRGTAKRKNQEGVSIDFGGILCIFTLYHRDGFI